MDKETEGFLYSIFQMIVPSAGESAAIMGVCPTLTAKSKLKDYKIKEHI
ncbi:hypothetical protein STRDD11_00127 [Streptococcus sp. DD11]|nr:hypothetical protein STRDD11_00127 [Streptococcus sp. DD11]